MKKIITSFLIAIPVLAFSHDNWVNSSGQVWKNSTGQCWRNSSWTPATSAPECDGVLQKSVVTKLAETSQVAPAPTVVIEKNNVVSVKASFQTDTFFDFDKSVIKPQGKQALDELAIKIKNITLEVVIVIGHTDSIGSDAYNMKLGERRANAVKAYLVSKGIDTKRIYTESKGERQPIADNKISAGRAKNRRVEVEVTGTR